MERDISDGRTLETSMHISRNLKEGVGLCSTYNNINTEPSLQEKIGDSIIVRYDSAINQY